ncbi:serine hydrolase [Loigolactobacillus jiayinensis]|uniref:Serine hydrolase n=1 Tax=Loigolactobacillus jiayinensis TaxID=2486016 RepID=A0ABW1RAR2_9LACO|nr:serine hydrolase [Loigolactobacillus jiayinensis]
MAVTKKSNLSLIAFFVLLNFEIYAHQFFKGSLVIFVVIFAILGFLLTATILDTVAKDGHFRWHTFLVRSGRLLLVPLVAMLVLSLLGAWLFRPSLLKEVGIQIAATLGFVRNFWEMARGVGHSTPVVQQLFFQTWPVAVGVQLLLGWSFCLWGLSHLGRHAAKKVQWLRGTTCSLAIIAGVFGLAFLIRAAIIKSSVLSLSANTLTYLVPFSLGSIVACLTGNEVVPNHFRQQLLQNERHLSLIVGGGLLLVLSLFLPIQNRWQLLIAVLLGSLLALVILYGIRKVQVVRGRRFDLSIVPSLYQIYLLMWPANLILRGYFSQVGSPLFSFVIAVGLVTGAHWFNGAFSEHWRHYVSARRMWLGLMSGAVVLVMAGVTFSRVNSAVGQPAQAANSASTQSTPTADSTKTSQTQNTSVQKNTYVAQELKTAWNKILATTNSQAQIAVYSKATGQVVATSNVASGKTFNTASIVKVAVAAEMMKQRQEGKLTLTSSDEAYAQAMIENSDNDATTYLLANRLGGYDATKALFKGLNMTQTTADAEAWGTTTTTATDQIKLLNAIYYGTDGYLNTKSRTYIMDLMNAVESDQDWGVSAGATTYQLKNGWLNDDDGSWMVNSIGHVDEASTTGADYTIAVLTAENSDEDTGINLIESLASATHEILVKNN